MKEYSIGIIKPDAMNQRHEILSIIEKKGLKVIFQKKVRLDKQSLMKIYKEVVEEDYFQSFSEFMTSGECLAFVVKGENAIEALNELVGASDPQKAKAGTLRNKFGADIKRNAIHSSADKEHFQKEIRVLFPEVTLDKPYETRVKSLVFYFISRPKFSIFISFISLSNFLNLLIARDFMGLK